MNPLQSIFVGDAAVGADPKQYRFSRLLMRSSTPSPNVCSGRQPRQCGHLRPIRSESTPIPGQLLAAHRRSPVTSVQRSRTISTASTATSRTASRTTKTATGMQCPTRTAHTGLMTLMSIVRRCAVVLLVLPGWPVSWPRVTAGADIRELAGKSERLPVSVGCRTGHRPGVAPRGALAGVCSESYRLTQLTPDTGTAYPGFDRSGAAGVAAKFP